MRKTDKMLLGILAGIAQIFAQGDSLYAMKNGSVVFRAAVADIDSIIFYKPVPSTVTDIDGNVYKTVKIGTQVWMQSDLKTTRYNDSTVIPRVVDNTIWWQANNPGSCWYKNDSVTYASSYGLMYNWHVVNTMKLCPKGWHVPSKDEWSTLSDSIGGLLYSGGKIKETDTLHWKSPNTGATNSTGFTGRPGGMRYYDGSFDFMGLNGAWWSQTVADNLTAWRFGVESQTATADINMYPKSTGFCVRCIMDK